jgi:SAM-dependent methyltransferase
VPAGDVDYGSTWGDGYAARRRTDPRIAAAVHAALGPARSVVNVGAGAGSYEPADRFVLAVEPSAAMRAQRPPGSAPVVAGVAEALPLRSASFDAALAVVTVHQWPDLAGGLAELRRVARGRVVVLTFERSALRTFWLSEYVPEVVPPDERRMPPVPLLARLLGGDVAVEVVPLPLDCVDGVVPAYYGRPEAYLDPAVRRAQSVWAFTPPEAVERGLAALAADLASGAWDARWGHLRAQPTYDGGLRLVVATPPAR